ncbi:MAG TPA: condensation domain-containing protein [Roseomonas sp.]|jgi:thioesterase domain-containing protein/aryl carrier-like protein
MSLARSETGLLEEEATMEFPATVAQRQVWLKARAGGADPTLNVAARWHIEGSIDLPLLEHAWRLLVDRHETLRTRFVARGADLFQQVLPAVPFAIRHIDLRHLPAGERAAEAERLGQADAATPFTDMAPPMLRITVLQRDDRYADMLLTTHHLVSDCWSNLILVRELCEACEALSAQREPSFPELPMQFGDYAAWQEAWLAEGGAAPAEAYWTRRLEGLADFAVPIDHPPPAVPTRRGDIVGVMVPAEAMSGVLAAARDRGATIFSFGLAMLATALSRWTGQTDILVTTQIAGREELELEAVAGPFINTIALRSDCAGDPSFQDLLDRVLGTVGEALEHGALPFELLQQRNPPPGNGRRGVLDGVNFQVLNSAFLKDSDAGGFALKGFPSLSPGSKRDLDFYLVERPFGWRVQCEYDPDLLDRGSVEWLVETYIRMLVAAAAKPGLRLSELPFVPKAAAAVPAPAAPATPLPAAAAVPAAVTMPVADPAGAERLLAIWREVLKRDSVAADANFFALGGDSLRAAQLLARAEAAFGKRIGLAQLFRAPTPKGMAALFGIDLPDQAPAPAIIETADAEDDWQIIPLREEGTGAPVIGINNIAVMHALSELPGIDRPIFCIRLFEPGRPHDIDGLSFGEVGARYVALLRRAVPRGPYVVFGECVHGSLAYEVAQQLRAAGETVELLVGVNMWHPEFVRQLSWMQRQRVRMMDLAANFGDLRAGRKTLLAFLGTYSLPHRLGLFRALKALGLIRAIPVRAGLAEEQEDFLLRLLEARSGYTAPAYDGPVLQLIKPDAAALPGFRSDLGWTGVITGPLVHRFVRHVGAPAMPGSSLPSIEEAIAATLATPGPAAAR